jgi:MFS family permease
MKKYKTHKTVKTLGWASFLNDLGADMIFPIWPIFVTSVLGANMTALGFLDGLSDAFVAISQAASGYWSDRIRKRKVFVWLGYAFAGAARIGYALATIWQQLIPFRILDRSGKIRGAPRDAIVADLSEKEVRGKNFGHLRMMDHLGAVCGIVFCIFFSAIVGYKNLFLIAAVPSIIGAAIIFFKVVDVPPAEAKPQEKFSVKHLSKNFKLFIFASAVFYLGAFSYSFLLIFAKHFGFSESFIPVLYLIYTLVATIFSIPFGRWTDRWGRKKMLLVSYGFWMLTCLTLILSQSYLAIILAFILYGIQEASLEPAQKAFISELAPIQYRASSLGLFQIITGLCALPASLLAGLFWDKIGIFSPFYISLGLAVLAILLLAFVKESP